jgi:hypothetical protein
MNKATHNTKMSVFESTADLMMSEESFLEPSKRTCGVDWKWGSDDDEPNDSSAVPETEDPSKVVGNEEEDSDATAEMDSDDEEVSQRPAETPPDAVPDVKPMDSKMSLENSFAPSPERKDVEMTETLSHDDESVQQIDNEHAKYQVNAPSSPSESTTLKSRRTRRPRKTVIQSDSEADEDMQQKRPSRRFRTTTQKTSKRVATVATVTQDNLDDDGAERMPENSRQTKPSGKPSGDSPPTDKVMGGDETIDEEDLLRSTDFLFVNADKDSVTVADICRALSAEYDCKIPKTMRKIVRERLVDLMKGNVTPQIAGGFDQGSHQVHDEDQISEQGDVESEQSDSDEPPDSDDEYDEADSSSKPKRARKQLTVTAKTQANVEAQKPKPSRPSQRKAAKAARMVEAERRRKKRMEELRVRNEEMQLNQSKEEQERAEAIAAKFETNTAESRLKRLEDRLTLLELLDKKRIAVIDALESEIEKKEAAAAAALEEHEKVEDKQEDKGGDDTSDASSSDEDELDIIGITKPFKPLKPIHTHMPSKALDILKDFRLNQTKKPDKANVTVSSSPASLNKSGNSPSKKMGARGNLRQELKQKVRKQGNLWLARELGYKNEEDHLKDCQRAAEQKRSLVLKMEQARVEANERKLLRERILGQNEAVLGDDDDAEVEGDSEHADEDNEEDEEMQMAKEIEKESESADIDTGDLSGADTGGHVFDSTYDTEPQPLDRTADCTKRPSRLFEDNDGEAPSSQAQAESEEKELQLLETQPPIPSAADDNVEARNSFASQATAKPDGSKNSVGRNEGKPTTNIGIAEPDEKSAGPTSDFADEGEAEFEEQPEEQPEEKSVNRPRNAAWQAMLQKEAEKLKRLKKNRMQGLVEDQAEEEEEEEVAGLEDFGFSVKKKQSDDDDDDAINDDALNEDDLKHVVDEVSDNEGDEEAGDEARKRQDRREEQERHKEILRRMREGYDGRRGGIAGGGVGARGMHRFDQLVAADNREDAKRLGLLNDDELDSEDEGGKREGKADGDNEEEDEAALLDKILKDRFLHRTDVNLDENFSEDEEDPEEANEQDGGADSEAEEDRTQERLAKRFAKRARMQRLEEEFADSQEFSQQRLIDEDESMRHELSQMKNGLVRQRTISSGTRTSSISSQESRLFGQKRAQDTWTTGTTLLDKSGGSLSIALRASRKVQSRASSFLGGDKAGKAKDSGAFIHKSVALSHVVFASANPSALPNGTHTAGQKRKLAGPSTSSLFSKVRKAQ